MGQAQSSSSAPAAETSSALPPSHPPIPKTTEEQSACPVDHKARAAWMQAARQQQTAEANAAASGTPSHPFPKPKFASSRLSTDRQVSTIPRAFGEAHSAPSNPNASSHGSPTITSSPNAQTLDPHTSAQGTWVYPSESMFFSALQRKNYSAKERDMASVVPIHNAVNERAWVEIQAWEAPYCRADRGGCGTGPKLVSFAGDSTKLTPRARWNGLVGYEAPFDRHDWVIDRCGTKIEYVIDFYQGKSKMGSAVGPTFYLDVRPKLNSWEGIRMRGLRAVGLEGW